MARNGNGTVSNAAGTGGSSRVSSVTRAPRAVARGAAGVVKAMPAGPQPTSPLSGAATHWERRYSFNMLVATAVLAFVAGRIYGR